MRVLLAGATGAIGTQLVPRLVAAGHEVHGMTRYESKQPMLDELGAVSVVADALDPDQVAEAVGRARPDVIVHQLTALAGVGMRNLKRAAALTNRLRTEGTDHLLSAGQAVGVRRFVAQSIGMGSYVRTGGPVKSEEDPSPPPLKAWPRSDTWERTWMRGGPRDRAALRRVYGPGTNMAPAGRCPR